MESESLGKVRGSWNEGGGGTADAGTGEGPCPRCSCWFLLLFDRGALEVGMKGTCEEGDDGMNLELELEVTLDLVWTMFLPRW